MKKVAIFLALFIALHSGYATTVCKKVPKAKEAQNHYSKKKPEKETEKAEDEPPLTGTFDITSNYLFRGISQSNNTPAFQGGLTYTFKKTGIYFSIWGSNVYMPVPDSTDTATLEIDPSIGITNDINDNMSYDIYLLRYLYPKASVFQYNELIASFTYRFLTGLIGYSNNVFNVGKSGTYYNLTLSFDLPPRYVYFNDLNISGGMGYYALPEEAGNSYLDYALSINKKIKNYTLTVQWTDTNHKLLDNSLDHAHIIGMVTADF